MPEPAGILGLTDRVRDEIHRHVFANPDREVGGVLVGRRIDARAVQVRGMIPALEAVGERAAVTFTHDAWELVHRELDHKFPDQQIVGWYHSHPGFGIFLSRDDLFIHESFFSEPWQFAYVIDPIGLEEGEFAWSGRSVVPVQTRPIAPPPGYRAPAPRPRQAVAASAEPAPVTQGRGSVAPQPPSGTRRRYPLAAIIAPLVLGLALGFGLAPAIGIGDGGDEPPAPAPAKEGAATPQLQRDAAPAATREARRPSPGARGAGSAAGTPIPPASDPTPAPATPSAKPVEEQAPEASAGGVEAQPEASPEGSVSKAYCERKLAEEAPPEKCSEILGLK